MKTPKRSTAIRTLMGGGFIALTGYILSSIVQITLFSNCPANDTNKCNLNTQLILARISLVFGIIGAVVMFGAIVMMFVIVLHETKHK